MGSACDGSGDNYCDTCLKLILAGDAYIDVLLLPKSAQHFTFCCAYCCRLWAGQRQAIDTRVPLPA